MSDSPEHSSTPAPAGAAPLVEARCAPRRTASRHDPVEQADALKTALLLPGEPVGVRIFTDADAFEAWPWPHPASPLYYCSAIKMAAENVTLKLGLADISCDTSPRVLGLEPGFFDDDFIESYVTCGLYRDREVADAVLVDVATLLRTVGVAVGPLSAFAEDSPPDVVIVATTPYGAMRVTQAVGFDGHVVRSRAIGMHGICSESTAAPLVTGDVCVSLLCSGTRYVAGWDEQLMSVGIPRALVADVVDGLVATAERYETDERKGQMRAACRCRRAGEGSLGAELGSLADGTGYFVRE
jgi:uncharacterized protein (DUF169 family)